MLKLGFGFVGSITVKLKGPVSQEIRPAVIPRGRYSWKVRFPGGQIP